MVGSGPDFDDGVDDGAGDVALVALVDADRVETRAQQQDGVGVVTEAHAGLADVVGDDQVESLGAELRLGVGEEIARLGGEPDEHLPRTLGGAEPGQDVRRLLQDDLRHAVALLELAIGGLLRTEVGDGGGHDDDGGVAALLLDRRLQLGGSFHAAHAGANWWRTVDGADEHDVGPACRRLSGDRVALLARAAVGDDPHGVDRLARPAGGDDEPHPGEIGARRIEEARRCRHDLDRIGQPSSPGIAPSQAADGGPFDVDAAATQRGDVLGDCRVLPHLGVHGRADEHRRPRGEQRGHQQVVRQAGGVGGDHPGRGGSDDDEVRGLPEPRVRDRISGVPELGLHRLAGERTQRRTTEEVFGAPRHDGHDVRSGIDQTATHLDRLVGGDAPGDPKDDARSGQQVGARCSAVAGVLGELFVERPGLSLGLGRFGPADLVSGDLLETDAERLPGDGADLRRDHVTEAFAELVEVRVDVAGTPRGQRDEAELGVDAIEELLDRRVHHRVVGAFHVSPDRDPPASRSDSRRNATGGFVLPR